MAQIKRNQQTWLRYQARQAIDRWGCAYQPAIKATPREAPSVSQCTILNVGRFEARDVHCLSNNERNVAILALHNPNLWYIREQQILCPVDRPHFLAGHAEAGAEEFLPFKGTVRIAKELGLKDHPKVRIRTDKHPDGLMMPFPYVGDLLLFLRDQQGAYAVNLTVKDKFDDFNKPFSILGVKTLEEARKKAEQRHQIENLYYASARIRTEQVAGRALNKQVIWNLLSFFSQDVFAPSLNPDSEAAAYSIGRDALGTNRTATKVAAEIERTLDIERGQGIKLIWRGIWRREIRVDLHQPVLPDRPLRPEVRDVLDEHAAWFRR